MRPLTLVYLEAVGRLNKRARTLQRERDDALDLCLSLTADLHDSEQECAGWKRRAEALYDACSEELRDGVLGVINTIERMPEVADG